MSKLRLFPGHSMLLCIMSLMFATLGCQPESAAETSNTEEQTEDTLKSESGTEQAQPESKNEIVEQNSDSYDGFLLGKFRFDIAIDAMVDEPITELKGRIIEFRKDYAYRITKDNAEMEKGTFTYDRNEQVLTLEATKGLNSQWKINYMDGTMIWVGTHVYGNNSRQMRLYEVK